MGAPNATEIPEADAADRTSRFVAIFLGKNVEFQCDYSAHVPSLLFKLPKGRKIRLAQQHATCTSGPSLPSHKLDATERHFHK